jgi:hypothetical protein
MLTVPFCSFTTGLQKSSDQRKSKSSDHASGSHGVGAVLLTSRGSRSRGRSRSRGGGRRCGSRKGRCRARSRARSRARRRARGGARSTRSGNSRAGLGGGGSRGGRRESLRGRSKGATGDRGGDLGVLHLLGDRGNNARPRGSSSLGLVVNQRLGNRKLGVSALETLVDVGLGGLVGLRSLGGTSGLGNLKLGRGGLETFVELGVDLGKSIIDSRGHLGNTGLDIGSHTGGNGINLGLNSLQSSVNIVPGRFNGGLGDGNTVSGVRSTVLDVGLSDGSSNSGVRAGNANSGVDLVANLREEASKHILGGNGGDQKKSGLSELHCVCCVCL